MGASAPSSQPRAAEGAGDQPSQRLSAGHGVREASGSGAEPREPTGQAGQHDEDWEKMRRKREAYETAQAAEGTPQEEPRSSKGNPAPDMPGRHISGNESSLSCGIRMLSDFPSQYLLQDIRDVDTTVESLYCFDPIQIL